MKIRIVRACALLAVAVCTLAACAGIAQSDIEKTAPEVKVYQLGENIPRPYGVVAHLPADNWRSSFLLPMYPSQDEAIAALQTEASRRGADGLINIVCFDERRSKWLSSSTDPAILCYGLAIRVRPSQG